MSIRSVRRGILPLVTMLVALTACTTGTSTPSQQEQQLPPSEYALNGTMVSRPPAEWHLPYRTYVGYRDQAYTTIGADNSDRPDPLQTTLDRVLPQPRPLTGPLISDYQQLEPAVSALPDVTQRAIMAIRQRVLTHDVVNLLPSRLSFAPKPDGALPADTRIKDDAGYIGVVTFSAAYIERKDNTLTTVLVTLRNVGFNDQADASYYGTFKPEYGMMAYYEPYKLGVPGPGTDQALAWRATLLQSDCSQVNASRNVFSSGCAYADNRDAQAYAGAKHVVLVASVAQLAVRHYDIYSHQGGVTSVDSYPYMTPVMPFDGTSQYVIQALHGSGWPFSQAPFKEPVPQVLAALMGNGSAIGGNDIAQWPAFAVTSK